MLLRTKFDKWEAANYKADIIYMKIKFTTISVSWYFNKQNAISVSAGFSFYVYQKLSLNRFMIYADAELIPFV